MADLIDPLDHKQMTAANWARHNQFLDLLPRLVLKTHEETLSRTLWEKIKTKLNQIWNRG